MLRCCTTRRSPHALTLSSPLSVPSADAKNKLEAKLEKFTEAWRALRARLGDPELVMDLQAPDGSVVGLRNIGAKYSSEVLGDRNVYTLCSVGECRACRP